MFKMDLIKCRELVDLIQKQVSLGKILLPEQQRLLDQAIKSLVYEGVTTNTTNVHHDGSRWPDPTNKAKKVMKEMVAPRNLAPSSAILRDGEIAITKNSGRTFSNNTGYWSDPTVKTDETKYLVRDLEPVKPTECLRTKKIKEMDERLAKILSS